MQIYTTDKATNLSVLVPDNDNNDESELLNFRLWARATNKDTGTWTVWNLQNKGDEFVIPLRRLPAVASGDSTQLKIGFLPGCVLRVPSNYKHVPRAVIECGYWGNGIRRTVVLEYKTRDKHKRMELKDVTIVLQRAIPWYKHFFFVGNTTVTSDIQTLSQKSQHDFKRNQRRKPVRMERLELQSMQRVVRMKSDLTDDDIKEATEILDHLFEQEQLSNSDAAAASFTMVLPTNELLASFPKEFLGNGKSRICHSATKTFIFAHEWKHNGREPFQALAIDFDSISGRAIAATMFSYK